MQELKKNVKKLEQDFNWKNLMKFKLLTCILLLFLGAFFSCNNNEDKSGKYLHTDGTLLIIFIKSQHIDKNTIESRRLFNKYLKEITALIAETEHESVQKKIKFISIELFKNEELINLSELYYYFDTEIQGILEKSIDDSELQVVSKVMYLYRDSVMKIDIDYLLTPSEANIVTFEWNPPQVDSVKSEEIIINNF